MAVDQTDAGSMFGIHLVAADIHGPTVLQDQAGSSFCFARPTIVECVPIDDPMTTIFERHTVDGRAVPTNGACTDAVR